MPYFFTGGACPAGQMTTLTHGGNTTTVPATTVTPIKKYPLRLPGTVTPMLYSISIKPDFYSGNETEFMFYGQMSVLVHCNENTDEIFMHVTDLHIAENSIHVTAEGGSGNLFQSLELVPSQQMIKISLLSPLMAGNNYTVEIKDFYAPIRDDLTGIYKGSFRRNGEIVYYVTSQLEVVEARKAFPCFDEPNLKARFDITIVRKPNWVALSNMPRSRTDTDSDGWEHDVFERTPIMPTYLLAFIVSDFTYRESNTANGVPLRIWARKAAENQTEFGMASALSSMNYLESYLDIPYNMPKQDMIAIKDFVWPAMENWGLIVFREDLLLYEPGVSSQANKYPTFRYIAHELAHNWFGNLVSPNWWNDLWIKEGVATFFEYRVMDVLNPDWRVSESFADDLTEEGFALDGLQSSHPLFLKGLDDPLDILRHYDSVSYKKGAAVTFMLEFMVGRDTFQRGFTSYLKQFLFGNAGHTDFFLAMQTQAQVENKTLADDIVDIMGTWVYQMGYPTVHVEHTGQGKMRLTQSRYLQDPQAKEKGVFQSEFGYTWDIPFTFTSNTEKDFAKIDDDIVLLRRDEGSVSILSDVIPGPVGDNWVIGNTEFHGYYRVNYDERNWRSLINQLINDHTLIDPLNRIQIISDAFSFVRSGEIDLNIALKILEYLRKERSYAPLNKLMREVQFMDKMLKNQPVYGKFRKFMRDSLKQLVTEYGFIDDGSNYIASHMRGIALKWACYYGVEECTEQAQQLMSQWMANQSVKPPGINPEVSETVYCTAVKYGDETVWDFVMQRLKVENVETESHKFLKALTCTSHKWLRIKMIRSILITDIIPNPLVYRATMNAGHAFPELTWDFFRNNYDELLERLGTTWFGRLLMQVVDEFNTELRLEELVRLGESKADEKNAEHDIAVEHVKNNIKWMHNVDKIEQWLNGLGY
ncbi:aminopeptidase N-like isoform X2 [Mercenaria mercenaria]|uniref:aminopeptidase N-like isoform X2 n=1 Tax=Mercenaria mercenaria TaxID=6596 RepID=UPI00234EA58D|nr:aminopeptidase N-like isoform X2 [Mercenaria mercenaria]